MPLDIHLIRYTKAAIKEEHRDEFRFVLSVCQFANEISLLKFQMLIAMQSGTADHEQAASAALTLLNARILCGRMYEAWKYCARHPKYLRFFKGSQAARESWKKLNRYFQGASGPLGDRANNTAERLATILRLIQLDASAAPPRTSGLALAKKELGLPESSDSKQTVSALRHAISQHKSRYQSLIERIRHEVAFHNSDFSTDSAFELIPENRELRDFHTSHRGAILYGGAESIVVEAMAHVAGRANTQLSLDAIMNDVINISSEMFTYFEAVNFYFFTTHYKNLVEPMRSDKITIQNPPELLNMRFDYFCFPGESDIIARS